LFGEETAMKGRFIVTVLVSLVLWAGIAMLVWWLIG
jgi:hypothetical protein